MIFEIIVYSFFGSIIGLILGKILSYGVICFLTKKFGGVNETN